MRAITSRLRRVAALRTRARRAAGLVAKMAQRVAAAVVWRLPEPRFHWVRARFAWSYHHYYLSRRQLMAVRRHLADLPRPSATPERAALPRFGLVARTTTCHFVEPLLEAISDHFELFQYPAYSAELFRDARKLDVLWIEWGTGSFLLERLGRAKGPRCRVICRIHDHELRLGHHIEGAAWEHADHILFINRDAMAEFEARTRGQFRDKQHFIPNGVDERFFARLALTRSQSLLAGAAPTAVPPRALLLSEGYAPRKNYRRAIELLARARQEVPELGLLLKADPRHEGSVPAPVLQAIHEHALEEAVTLLVPQGTPEERKRRLALKTEVAPVYAAAGCILSTSDHEGFHYAVAEGMLSGLYPIVWPWRWGRPQDFWGPYVARDEDDFVRRLVAWARADAPRRGELGREAHAYCASHFGQAASRAALAPVLPELSRPRAPEHRRRLVLFAHNHLYRDNPHGGEKSMARIVEDLQAHGYDLLVIVRNQKNGEYGRESFAGVPVITVPHTIYRQAILDILTWWRPRAALMWELPARDAWELCVSKGIPYQLFIRYWHLINPPPYRDLLTDPIDTKHRDESLPIFRNAASIVVNAEHVRRVVQRFFAVDSRVAYVPVTKLPPLGRAADRRFITLINARKAHGGDLVRALARRLPERGFLVIDAEAGRDAGYPANVTARPYDSRAYNLMLRDTRVLLFPFDEEPCGTGRVVLEAYSLGIPVVAPARGGLPEKIPAPHLVPRNDDLDAWAQRLGVIEAAYDDAVRTVSEVAAAYDEARELAVVRAELERIQAAPDLTMSGEPGIELGPLGDDAYRLLRPNKAASHARLWVGDYALAPAPHPAAKG